MNTEHLLVDWHKVQATLDYYSTDRRPRLITFVLDGDLLLGTRLSGNGQPDTWIFGKVEAAFVNDLGPRTPTAISKLRDSYAAALGKEDESVIVVTCNSSGQAVSTYFPGAANIPGLFARLIHG